MAKAEKEDKKVPKEDIRVEFQEEGKKTKKEHF